VVMWWTRAERRRRRGGRGGACCGCHGADDQDGVDGAVLDGERVEQCAERAAPSRTTAPGSQAQAPPGPSGRARGRDGGRIIVTVVSRSRLPVMAQMSRARWPSSPTARSCGCLHRGSNAQAVSKTGEARASTCRWRAQVVSRGGWRASWRVRKLGQARQRTARARARAPAACAPVLRARAQRQGRPKAARAACVAAGRAGGHTCVRRVDVPGLEEVGDEVDRGVGRLARALAPRRVHGDVCAWVLCVQSGGAVVLISCGAAGRRGRDSGGDRTSN
jgi:hypothetical protein